MRAGDRAPVATIAFGLVLTLNALTPLTVAGFREIDDLLHLGAAARTVNTGRNPTTTRQASRITERFEISYFSRGGRQPSAAQAFSPPRRGRVARCGTRLLRQHGRTKTSGFGVGVHKRGRAFACIRTCDTHPNRQPILAEWRRTAWVIAINAANSVS